MAFATSVLTHFCLEKCLNNRIIFFPVHRWFVWKVLAICRLHRFRFSSLPLGWIWMLLPPLWHWLVVSVAATAAFQVFSCSAFQLFFFLASNKIVVVCVGWNCFPHFIHGFENALKWLVSFLAFGEQLGWLCSDLGAILATIRIIFAWYLCRLSFTNICLDRSSHELLLWFTASEPELPHEYS